MTEGLFALYAVVRGLIFVGLLILVGSQAARALLARELRADAYLSDSVQPRLQTLLRGVTGVLIAAVAARGFLQLLTFVDPGEAITFELTRSVLLSGTWGTAWMLQLTASAVLLVLIWFRPRAPAGLDVPTVLLVTALLWAQSGMGHPAGDTWRAPFGRMLDVAHLLGGGLWLGTLLVLMVVAVPALRTEERLPLLAGVVRRFSVFARLGASLVVVSGATAAVVYAGSVSELLGSTWGRLLLVKVSGMFGVVAVGWYNWRVVTPALENGQPVATASLQRAVRLELVLGLVMLAITTVLVVSPLPGEG